MASKKNNKPTTPPEGESPVPVNAETAAPVAALPLRWVRVTHHTPDHIATRYPYAGYGSNLNLEQMARRCPGADIVGQGLLRNARLLFAYHLGIAEDQHATVPVGVFRLTAADVAALDRYEALGRSYERFLVTVEVNGEAVRCFTYVKRDNEPEQPSEKYYQTCLQGYADFNFDSRRLRHAREHARKNEKPKRYGKGYDSSHATSSGMDWRDYMTTGRGQWGQRGDYRASMVPSVPSMDGSGTAGGQGKVSLVTGRRLAPRDNISGRPVSPPREPGDHGPAKQGKNGNANSPYMPGDEFTNPRTKDTWIMGKNRVWLRKEG
jgi:hypothetical protein